MGVHQSPAKREMGWCIFFIVFSACFAVDNLDIDTDINCMILEWLEEYGIYSPYFQQAYQA